MREDLATKFNELRIAPMTRIGLTVDDFGLDPCRPVAQHDNPAGKEQRLFHIMGHEQRGKAGALPQ